MRICLLADASNIHTRRMALGLAGKGHDVRVISHKNGSIPGIQVQQYAVPALGLSHPARWRTRRELYLRRIMREHDVVHLHFLHDWFLTPEIAAEGRLIVTPWGSDIIKPPDLEAYPPELVEMRRSLLQMAHVVVTFGQWFAQQVCDFSDLTPDAVIPLKLGVDLRTFRRSTSDRATPPTVGFFKGFKAVYGPQIWLEAIGRIHRVRPDVRFEMIGGGPMLEHCKTLARDNGSERAIEWLGYQPDEAMPRLIERWSLAAIPSYSESFCVAALEAQAMGVPVVASRTGGLTETVQHGSTGILVPYGDVDALAREVLALLDNPERLAEMAQSGREMVECDFDWSHCLDEMVHLYERVCDPAMV